MADSMELRSSNPPFDEEAAIGINASGGKPYRSSSDTLNHLLPAESAAPRPQPATPARDHRASIKEPQLPEVFTSVPEVRADILAVLVRKYDVEYNTAVETADRWRMATGGSLLSMEADQLSDIFGSELGRSLCDTIRHQQEDLKSQRRYTEAIYCKMMHHKISSLRFQRTLTASAGALPILSLFALCLSGIYRGKLFPMKICVRNCD